MNASALPLKRQKTSDKKIWIRIEEELKADLDRLNQKGVDTPEWLRILIRDAVSHLKTQGKL